MGPYKKRRDKGKISFFVLSGLFALFLVLSFFSINSVYGFDSEIITSSSIDSNNVDNSLVNNLNQNNLVLEDNLDPYNESIYNTSSNLIENFEGSNDTINVSTNISEDNLIIDYYDESLTPVLNSEYINLHLNNQSAYSVNNDKCKCTNVYLMDNGDNLEKIGEKPVKLDDIDFNGFYSIFQYPDSNGYRDNFNDFSHYINNHIVILISNSNFKGNSFENFNNFIKEIANFNFNKIDNEEDTSVIQDFQSSPKPTLTILFFIKIFMKLHDNGKERLTSF